MRKQFFFLELLILFVSVNTHASALSSRGFIVNKCYGHVGKSVQENKNCYLEVFSENRTHLSFQLDECPHKSVNKNTIYARFKLLTIKDKITAHIIDWTSVDQRISKVLVSIDMGMARPAACN